MINAKMKTGSTVYCGPSSSIYASVGSVDAGADVVLICRDPIDSNYVYAGYAINVGEAADAKRGYIPVSAVNVSVTDVNKLPARSANGRACRCTSKLTVINKPVGGSASVGSISANESFTRFDETDNAYTYVEYSTSSKTKRGFVLTSSLSSGSNTGRTGVVAESCDVYHGPDLDGYAKVGSVDAGEVVAVLEYETPISADKWLMIEYNTTSGRKRGYVPRHYISITSFSGVNVMRKIQSIATFAGTASAKAYYGPNTTFPSVGSIGAGELVSLIDQWDTNGSYRFIEYNTSGGKKRGYVAGTFSNATGFDHRAAMNYDVYHGPDTSNYAKVGSVDQGDPVKIIWQEGDWFYIQYPAKSNLKAGFVPKTVIKDYAGISTDTHSYAGHMQQVNAGSQAVDVKAGPDASFAKVGTVSPTEGVTVFNYTKDGYTYIEYATSKGTKRGYIPTSSLNPETVQGKLAYVSDAKAGAYVGTDTTYFKAGGVYQGEFVVVLAEDKETIYQTKWSYIEYNSSAGRKRGYVDKTSITLLPYTGQIPATVRSRLKMCAVVNDGNVMYGPGSYAKVGTVSAGERVIVLQEDGPSQYSYIEYSTGKTASKRGYVPNSNLTDVSASFKTVPAPGNAALKREYSDGVSTETLEYYQFGGGPNVLIAYFAEHGFEDAWAADGWELAQIGCGVFDRLYSQKDNLSGWTVYVIPCLNRKGVLNGWTNNGPGRTAVDSGVDINRWFPTNNFKYYSDARNWNRASVREGNLLKSFITSKKSSSSVTIALDVHGWLGYSIGDAEIGKSFIDQFNFYNKSLANGSGYSAKWCQEQGIKASLIELPLPANPAAIISGNYAGKVADAIVDVMGKSWSGSVSTTSYSLGAEGSMVELFQAYLKYNGYFLPMVDGRFRESTVDAVKKYQADQNLISDGIIGSETWVTMGFSTSLAGEVDTSTTTYQKYRKYADYYVDVMIGYHTIPGAINEFYISDNNYNMKSGTDELKAEHILNDVGITYQFYILYTPYGFRIKSKLNSKLVSYDPKTGEIVLDEIGAYSDYYQLWSVVSNMNGSVLIRNIYKPDSSLTLKNNKWCLEPGANLVEWCWVTDHNDLTSDLFTEGVKLYNLHNNYAFDITRLLKTYLESYLQDCYDHAYITENEYELLDNHDKTFEMMNADNILHFWEKADYGREWDISNSHIWNRTKRICLLPFSLNIIICNGRVIEEDIPVYLRGFTYGYLGRAYGFGETALRWLLGILKKSRSLLIADSAAHNGVLSHDESWYKMMAAIEIGYGPFSENETMGIDEEEFKAVRDGISTYIKDENRIALKIDGAIDERVMNALFGLPINLAKGNAIYIYAPLRISDTDTIKNAGKTAAAVNIAGNSAYGIELIAFRRLLQSGISLIPVFNSYANKVDYFTYEQGRQDGIVAKTMLDYYQIPDGTRIYFSYLFSPKHIGLTGEIYYFEGIRSYFDECGISNRYSIGVYGDITACIVASNKYSMHSFLYDISEIPENNRPDFCDYHQHWAIVLTDENNSLRTFDVEILNQNSIIYNQKAYPIDWNEIILNESGLERVAYNWTYVLLESLKVTQMFLKKPPLDTEIPLFDWGYLRLSLKVSNSYELSIPDTNIFMTVTDHNISMSAKEDIHIGALTIGAPMISLDELDTVAVAMENGLFALSFTKTNEGITVTLSIVIISENKGGESDNSELKTTLEFILLYRDIQNSPCYEVYQVVDEIMTSYKLTHITYREKVVGAFVVTLFVDVLSGGAFWAITKDLSGTSLVPSVAPEIENLWEAFKKLIYEMLKSIEFVK